MSKSVHLEEGILSRLKFALAKSYQSGSNPLPSAGNNLKRCKDFYLQAKARIWHWLSYVPCSLDSEGSRGSSLITNCLLLGPYSRTMPRALYGPKEGGLFGIGCLMCARLARQWRSEITFKAARSGRCTRGEILVGSRGALIHSGIMLCPIGALISSRRIFMTNTRVQWKLPHTWIILVIVKQHLEQIGRVGGPTEYSSYILAVIKSTLKFWCVV